MSRQHSWVCNNGVIGQYVCKMNRCKLCDAPVLESRNRRQLASTTSQRCSAVLMGLAIETKKKKRNLGESMNQGTCVQDASTRSRSTWHCKTNWIALERT